MVEHWRRQRSGNHSVHILINGLGAVSTGIAIVVILVAKFVDGAWITLLLIPGLYLIFVSVKRHYVQVEIETDCTSPIDVRTIEPPIVVVPVGRWSTISAKAVRFSMRISPEVIAVHISSDPMELLKLKRQWETCVENPCIHENLNPPKLVILPSPYRRLFGPLLDFIRDLQEKQPNRIVAVVLPELVEHKWYQYMLHNQRATWLKAALLWRGDRRVVVINVPWYLGPVEKR
jgi:hypothetical protein